MAAAYLSARQAAKVCGVSEKTMRNWINAGRVHATRSAGGFRIDPDQLPQRAQNAADPDQVRAEGADSADHSAVMLELVRLVDRLQQENRELAAENARLRALPSAPPEIASGSPTDASRDETIATTSPPVKRGRWAWLRRLAGA
jgi:excisionase family DNA binding protein